MLTQLTINRSKDSVGVGKVYLVMEDDVVELSELSDKTNFIAP